MKKICVLESIKNHQLIFINGDEKVTIPATSEDLCFFSNELDGDTPVLAEIDIENNRLVNFDEQAEYKQEFNHPTLIGSFDVEEVE